MSWQTTVLSQTEETMKTYGPFLLANCGNEMVKTKEKMLRKFGNRAIRKIHEKYSNIVLVVCDKEWRN